MYRVEEYEEELHRRQSLLSSPPERPVASDWFITSTGRSAYVSDPQRSDVSIIDIAHSLSRQCRFAGHLRHDVEHYSVAQHSVLVSMLCAPEHALAGLLHDATEAYLQDIIRPLKHSIGDRYKTLELAWARHLGREFGLGDELANLHPSIKHADHVLLSTEKRDLVTPTQRVWAHGNIEPMAATIEPLDSKRARALFLRTFFVLVTERDARSWVT
jgi:hypothetical protein